MKMSKLRVHPPLSVMSVTGPKETSLDQNQSDKTASPPEYALVHSLHQDSGMDELGRIFHHTMSV